jgi:GH24 family phage-related lysozyme (muramidase)
MAHASIRSAAEHIARAGSITPHQLAALTALDESLTDPQRQGFTELWRAEGSPAAPAPAPAQGWLPLAQSIVKEFEGCKLKAYVCPAGELTIGWGSTTIGGKAVRQGQSITQAQADAQLNADLQRFYTALVKAIPAVTSWAPNRIAALVSWTYNVGVGGMQGSTLRKRLLAGEDPAKVAAEELPRWNKADGRELAGLTRRRAAELALFVGQQLQQQTPGRVKPSSPFITPLTPHIRLGEFALDQEARRFNHQHQVDTAAELAVFMERCRAAHGGKPVVITSGYRPAAINRSVGGASGSEHLYSAPGVGAVDFYIRGADIHAVQSWCDRHWPHSLGYGAPKGFVHLGIRAGRPRVRWDY